MKNKTHVAQNICNYCDSIIKDSEFIIMNDPDKHDYIHKPCCPNCLSNDITFDKTSEFYKGDNND